jgi:hypothetical protein
LGGEFIDRKDFLDFMEKNKNQKTAQGNWETFFSKNENGK